MPLPPRPATETPRRRCGPGTPPSRAGTGSRALPHRTAGPHAAPHPRQGRARQARHGRLWPTRHHGRGTPPQARSPAPSGWTTAHVASLAAVGHGHHLPGARAAAAVDAPPRRDWSLQPRCGAADRVWDCRDARAPTPRRRAQASVMRRWVWHADPPPGTHPVPDDRRCLGVARTRLTGTPRRTPQHAHAPGGDGEDGPARAPSASSRSGAHG